MTEAMDPVAAVAFEAAPIMASADVVAKEPSEVAKEPSEPAQKGLHPAVWITGLVAVIGGALYFFTKR
jgi:hypothetical protein